MGSLSRRAALPLALWLGCAPAPVAPAPAPLAAPLPVDPPAPSPAPPLPAPPPAPSPPACRPLALEPLPALPAPVDPPRVAIEDEGGALAPFLERVAALLRGERREPVRLLVYGDSNITADWVTGGLRRALQGRLGDAGHGFVALGQPWPGYVHMDVRHRTAPPGWAVHAVSTRPARDHRYGFAGIEAQSTGPGARAWIETAGAKAPVGRSVDRVEVHFLRGPGLGSFEVRVDGKPTATVATGQDTFAAGVARLDLEDGPHRLTFEARTRQPVRLFGASLERSVPGIVVDSAGIAASVTATLLRQDAEVMRDTLRRRSPDLIVLAHGTFDVAPWNTAEQHDQALGSLLQRLREALPGVALLVLSPVDYRGPIDDSRASPALASREKRALARKHGAAFWDLRAAMGGDRSIRNFRTHRMADPDQIHLNQKGGLFMGHRLAEALWGALGAHLARAPGCAPAGSPPSGR